MNYEIFLIAYDFLRVGVLIFEFNHPHFQVLQNATSIARGGGGVVHEVVKLSPEFLHLASFYWADWLWLKYEVQVLHRQGLFTTVPTIRGIESDCCFSKQIGDKIFEPIAKAL